VTSGRLARWELGVSAFADRVAEGLRRYEYVFLVLFSILYLLATCFRASRKLFWFDELFTLYMSRLPDMAFDVIRKLGVTEDFIAA
jgi:hypothetical protein